MSSGHTLTVGVLVVFALATLFDETIGCHTICATGHSCCGSRCYHLQTSNKHCGFCGNRCERDTFCNNGQCVPLNVTLDLFIWQQADRPILGESSAVNPADSTQTNTPVRIYYGGFSGLDYEGLNRDGTMKFVTITDRGPNAANSNYIDSIPGSERPFVVPEFGPTILRLNLNRATGHFQVADTIPLYINSTTRVTGFSNLIGLGPGLAYSDETPIDIWVNLLPFDPLGLDTEGIKVAPDGSFWVCDEYRPSLAHFDAAGILIERFIPFGAPTAGGAYGTEMFPEVYAKRRINRGFEGLAIDGELIYAFVQAALDNPDVANDATSKASKNARIMVFNTTSRSVTEEYMYIFSPIPDVDKIGDALTLGNGKFLVIERDSVSDAAATKFIYEIDIKGATNVHGIETVAATGLTLEQTENLVAEGIIPVSKRLVADLASVGFVGTEKIEGLALVDRTTIAAISDNDFNLRDEDMPGTGTAATFDPPIDEFLGIVNGVSYSARQ